MDDIILVEYYCNLVEITERKLLKIMEITEIKSRIERKLRTLDKKIQSTDK